MFQSWVQTLDSESQNAVQLYGAESRQSRARDPASTSLLMVDLA